jgi:hypothetical protein
MENIIKVDDLKPQSARQMLSRMEKSLHEADAMSEVGMVLRACAVFCIDHYGLYKAEGMERDEYMAKIGVKKRQLEKYISVAKYVEKWAQQKYPAKDGEPYLITSKMVMEFVKARKESSQPVTLQALHEERVRVKQLTAYLEDDTYRLEPNELAEVIAAPKPKRPMADQQPEAPPYLRAHLAQYVDEQGLVWVAGKGWRNHDGSELTELQRAHMTDYQDAIQVVYDAAKIISRALNEVNDLLKTRGKIFDRFYSLNSPKFEAEAKENARHAVLLADKFRDTITTLIARSSTDAIAIKYEPINDD